MPQLYNGIGTWYRGKKNLHAYEGICGSCGRQAKLTSYDTRLFFVVFLIPIIPLEKKRIIEECAVCSRHYAVPLKEWEQVREHTRERVAEYQGDPSNKDLAFAVLEATQAYRDRDTFAEMATEIEEHFNEDQEILQVLAAIYRSYRLNDAAERLFQRLVELDDSHENREALAIHLLENGDLEGCHPYLQHIVDHQIPDRVHLVFCLAQNYQIQGKHVEALQLYEACEFINPPFAQTDSFQKSKALAEKHQNDNTKIAPTTFDRIENSASRRFRLVATIAAVLLAVAAYGVVAWGMGRYQRVHLVNGLSTAYSVLINDTQYDLKPGERRSIRLTQGEVSIVPQGLDESLFGAGGGMIQTPFLTRPFDDTVFTINPDRTAILLWTRVFYGPEEVVASYEPQEKIHVGNAVYRWEDIDYPFEPFPDTITVSEHTKTVPKHQVTLLMDDVTIPKSNLLANISGEIGDEVTIETSKRLAALEPDGEDYLPYLFALMEREAFVDFLQPRLAARPIALEWHRFYQNAMETLGRFDEVEEFYGVLLEALPEDSAAAYLAGRVNRDPAEGERLYRRALSMEPPCARAGGALAYDYLAVGRFDEAGPPLEQALEAMGPDPSLLEMYLDYLMTTADTVRAEAYFRSLLEGEVFGSMQGIMYLASLLGKSNRSDTLDASVEEYLALHTDVFSDETQDGIRHSMRARAAYAAGDEAQYAEHLIKSSPTPEAQLAAFLSTGNLAAAMEVRGEAELGPVDYLLIWIVARSAGKRELEDEMLEAACDSFEEWGYEEHLLAEAIRGKSTLSAQEIALLHVDLERKIPALVVLGMIYPEDRAVYVDMAKKLNVFPRYPKLLLDRALAGLATSVAQTQ